MHIKQTVCLLVIQISLFSVMYAQQTLPVKLVKENNNNRINVLIGNQLFTSFFYPDTLEKPVLYPIVAANGTKGYPWFSVRPGSGGAYRPPTPYWHLAQF